MINEFIFDINSQDETTYFLAGKAIMSSLLSESFELIEILKIDEKIIRAQRSESRHFYTGRINNAADFPDFSKIPENVQRNKIERFFLIIAGGIWAQSIFIFNRKNKIKKPSFNRIQTLAVESNSNKLFALRSVLSRLQIKIINWNSKILEDSFLDYEAFLYRQSFAIISHSFVWNTIIEIAENLKANEILYEVEINRICERHKEFLALRRESSRFYLTI